MLVALVCLCVAALGWAAWRWWPRAERPAPPVEVQAELPAGSASPSSAAGANATATARLLVHVVGRVRHPGVYEIDPGGRVADAVKAAGGLLGDACAEAINLARVVSDGEQIVVPSEKEAQQGAGTSATGAAGAGAPPAGAVAAGPGGLVDVNTADAALLDTLPGVGPATAQRIIADRQSSGPFRGVDDLGRVSGIGPKKLEQLRSLVCAK